MRNCAFLTSMYYQNTIFFCDRGQRAKHAQLEHVKQHERQTAPDAPGYETR